MSEVARVTLTPQLAELLDRLSGTGIHGRNRADVVRRIIGAWVWDRQEQLCNLKIIKPLKLRLP